MARNLAGSAQFRGAMRPIALTAPAPPRHRIVDAWVAHEGLGYPLVGAHVRAVAARSAAAGRRVLGRGIVGPAGRVVVDADASRVVDRAYSVQVFDVEGGRLLTETRPRSGGVEVIEVDFDPEEPTARTWSEMANRLQDGRVGRLNELVDHLLLLAGGTSLFADWSLAARIGAVAGLESTLLDPTGVLRQAAPMPSMHQLQQFGAWEAWLDQVLGDDLRGRRGPADGGPVPGRSPVGDPDTLAGYAYEAVNKTQSFESVATVDYPLNLQPLGGGSPSGAIVEIDDFAIVGPAKPLEVDKSTVAYRDYLRTIFAGPPASTGYADRVAALRRRFHQDFETVDTAPTPADRVRNTILHEILRSPVGAEYGFGKDPALIEKQGSRTPREYLEYLVDLTGVPAPELGRRYRLDLDGPEDRPSSYVQQNIDTLQGFYTDNFHGDPDPHPIIPLTYTGPSYGPPYELDPGRAAPFFLHLTEWLDQQRFFAENHLAMKSTFRTGLEAADAAEVLQYVDNYPATRRWTKDVILAESRLHDGHEAYLLGQFGLAREHYLACWDHAMDAYLAADAELVAVPMTTVVATAIAKLPSMLPADHSALEAYVATLSYPGLDLADSTYWDFNNSTHRLEDWVKDNVDARRFALLRLGALILPACLGDTALQLGDHAAAADLFHQATRFLVGHASAPDDAGWPKGVYGGDPWDVTHRVRRSGPLAYTASASTTVHSGEYSYKPMARWVFEGCSGLAGAAARPVERHWLRLRHANVLLEWADELYRTDDGALIRRARELYKAVLLLHGLAPGTDPTWSTSGKLPSKLSFLAGANPNPARRLQVDRARKGLLQIEQQLNFYGLDDSLVPSLRHATLRESADRLAATAKSVQGDLLGYIGDIEDALEQRMVQSSALAKAGLAGQVAARQRDIAQVAVGVAEAHVADVQAQIAALKAEIEDHDSFLGQFQDFASGVKSALGGLPDGAVDTGKSGLLSAGGFGSYQGVGAMSFMAAGPAAVGGYGVMIYAGYSALGSMASAQNGRRGRLEDLSERALPAARAELRARTMQVEIARLSEGIADADADLARDLLRFGEVRTLNLETLGDLADLMRRMLRRVLEAGGRQAWLAERALAFEQATAINIIRLDYVPATRQGIGGADMLIADLDELELTRLAGLDTDVTVPVHVSLAFDHPIAFARLVADGSCRFSTQIAELVAAYPGTHGHRIRGVRATPQTMSGFHQYRGMLTNDGVSAVRAVSGGIDTLLLPPDGLPLGPWSTTTSPDVRESPTRRAFEGSGYDTTWTVDLPELANPYPNDELADVVITFDVVARYSPVLAEADHDDATTATVERAVIASALTQDQPALATLRAGSGPATFHFDVGSMLPGSLTNRSVENVGVVIAAPGDVTGDATLRTPTLADVSLSIVGGIATSNAPPLTDATAPAPPQPLNALVGSDPATTIEVVIDGTLFTQGDLTRARDVVLIVGYRADVAT